MKEPPVVCPKAAYWRVLAGQNQLRVRKMRGVEPFGFLEIAQRLGHVA